MNHSRGYHANENKFIHDSQYHSWIILKLKIYKDINAIQKLSQNVGYCFFGFKDPSFRYDTSPPKCQRFLCLDDLGNCLSGDGPIKTRIKVQDQ